MTTKLANTQLAKRIVAIKSMLTLIQLLLLIAPFTTAFRVTPASMGVGRLTAIDRVPAAITCQETDERPPSVKDLSSEQVDLVNRASDPFRIIRQVLYVTFGVVGLAGVVTSVMQMGDKPGDSLGNLVVNGAVLAAGIGVFFFDRSVTSKLREKVEAELSNPYLKGDAVLGDDEE